jgi:hypothetical protein
MKATEKCKFAKNMFGKYACSVSTLFFISYLVQRRDSGHLADVTQFLEHLRNFLDERREH